ncbi:hypothetical protein LINPERHAP2_LOCUS33146 [Linum perenne]
MKFPQKVIVDSADSSPHPNYCDRPPRPPPPNPLCLPIHIMVYSGFANRQFTRQIEGNKKCPTLQAPTI